MNHPAPAAIVLFAVLLGLAALWLYVNTAQNTSTSILPTATIEQEPEVVLTAVLQTGSERDVPQEHTAHAEKQRPSPFRRMAMFVEEALRRSGLF